MTQYLTLDQFAEREGVSKTTIKRWIKENKIPAQKLGKAWLIPAGTERPIQIPKEPKKTPPTPNLEGKQALSPAQMKSKFGTPRFQAFVRTVEAQGPTHPYWNWIQQGRKNGYKLPEEVKETCLGSDF